MTRSGHAAAYVVLRGLRGMGQAPIVQLVAIATMAVCMTLLGAVALAWMNASKTVQSWGVEVPITVYLADDVHEVDVDDLVARISVLPEVARVDTIAPEQALERLQQGLGEGTDLLEGIDAEVLPTSLEIHLAPHAGADVGPALVAGVGDQPIVDEVVLAGQWAGQANDLLATLQRLALGVALAVGLSCFAIVWSTIRLGVYARRDEVEILRLVGGTTSFVRGPFLVAGVVQGAVGAGVALALLGIGFNAVLPFLSSGLALVFAAGSLEFFSPLQIALGVLAGAAIGVVGSHAAVLRYTRT
jgi:cell division protein FtsX